MVTLDEEIINNKGKGNCTRFVVEITFNKSQLDVTRCGQAFHDVIMSNFTGLLQSIPRFLDPGVGVVTVKIDVVFVNDGLGDGGTMKTNIFTLR